MATTLNIRQISLIMGLSVMGFMINIDYTAVNLALLTMAKDVHASLESIQWVLSGYLLAWGAIVIPAARSVEFFGQRRVFAFGAALFMFSSVLVGLSSSLEMMVTGRILQGISGAIFFPILYSLIHSEVPEDRRGFSIGILSLGVGIGAAIGPSFGGAILSMLGWPWIFFVNVPIIIIAMLLILLPTAKDIVNKPDKGFLHPSALILSMAIVLLLYSINQVNVLGLHSMMTSGLIIISAILLLGFTHWQKSTKTPLIPNRLFNNKRYLGCTLAFSIEQYCFAASFLSMALYLQKILGFTPIKASFVLLALSIIFAVISSMGGIIVDKKGLKLPAVSGFVLLAMGSFGLTLLTESAPLFELIIVLFLLGVGMGLVFSALNTGIVTTVEQRDIAMGSSMFIMFALVGNALGIVITTAIFEANAAIYPDNLCHGISNSMMLSTVLAMLGLILIVTMLPSQSSQRVNATAL